MAGCADDMPVGTAGDMVATITHVLSNSVIDLAARRYIVTRDDLGEDE